MLVGPFRDHLAIAHVVLFDIVAGLDAVELLHQAVADVAVVGDVAGLGAWQ